MQIHKINQTHTFLLSTSPCFNMRLPSAIPCQRLFALCTSSWWLISLWVKSAMLRLRGLSLLTGTCNSNPNKRDNCLSSRPGSRWSGTWLSESPGMYGYIGGGVLWWRVSNSIPWKNGCALIEGYPFLSLAPSLCDGSKTYKIKQKETQLEFFFTN